MGLYLVDVSDIFYFYFSAQGGGRGIPRRRGGGGGVGFGFVMKGPGGSAANWGILEGGGAKFFLGPKYPPVDLDGPIRANRFAESRESPDSRESFQGSRTEPLFLRIALPGGLKIANRRFEAIRANRSHAMKTGFFSTNRFGRIAGPSQSTIGLVMMVCLPKV